MTHDIVFRDATIVDGSGGSPVRGDVAVDNALITTVGTVDTKGSREIDLGGRVLTPGFIDVHTHSDLMLLAQ
ncbi:MAG TPA: amidohydrolase, partial [Chloroflexi bacterium]|nr:amidohydrolase [Chloroflexota bacterium]